MTEDQISSWYCLSVLPSSDLMQYTRKSEIRVHAVQDGPAMFEQAGQLKGLVGKARDLLAEYSTVSRLALTRLQSTVNGRTSENGNHSRLDDARSSGLHVSLPHLEDEYRAKLLELESKLATAQLHVRHRPHLFTTHHINDILDVSIFDNWYLSNWLQLNHYVNHPKLEIAILKDSDPNNSGHRQVSDVIFIVIIWKSHWLAYSLF